ncbi:hypothetical protein [Neorhizobium sp. NCHU2750]|uniref:hypothetical protein n=1 Tax=Neorhizobium sp. NCHU2750 TaxID=1825976 RepID=UPI000E772119|nr:hypothetical protein NCHU2750_43780 [Neorhizobium sp. NCHU2750]
MSRRTVSISAYSDPKVIAALADQLQRCGVRTVEITAPDGEVRIVADLVPGAVVAQDLPRPVTTQSAEIPLAVAPIAGTFLRGHPSRLDDAADRDRPVKKGDRAGFIQVGPILVPVICKAEGETGPEQPESGSFVGYGSVLLQAKS